MVVHGGERDRQQRGSHLTSPPKSYSTLPGYGMDVHTSIHMVICAEHVPFPSYLEDLPLRNVGTAENWRDWRDYILPADRKSVV